MIQMKLIFSSFCKKDVDFLLHVKKVHIVNYNLPPSNTVVIGASACNATTKKMIISPPKLMY